MTLGISSLVADLASDPHVCTYMCVSVCARIVTTCNWSADVYMTAYSDLSTPLHSLSDVLKLVINMQQIASHPQLVQSADVLSPFHMVDMIDYHTARLLESVSDSSQHDVSVCMHAVYRDPL